MKRNSTYILVFACIAALSVALADDAQKAAPAGKIKTHIVQGMWSQHWKLPEILANNCDISESFMTSRYGFTTALKGFPMNKQDLFANRILILANIPADAFPHEAKTWQNVTDVPERSDAWVEEFLNQGGSVFVLGGNYSLGNDGNRPAPFTNSVLSKVLPVETHAGDIVFEKQNKPVELKPVGDHPILKGLNWKQKPVTMFYHEVTPKANMQVLIKAGDAPILIVGQYGKGRIVLLTATLHGEPPAGNVAYSQWDQWPTLVKNIAKWLAKE